MGRVIARYGLQELGGNVAYDTSGNGHHGEVVGPVVQGAPGPLGTSCLFGTASEPSYIEIPSHSDFSIGSAGLTVEGYMAPSTMLFTGTQAPLCSGFPAANYISFLNKQNSTYGGNPQAEWLLRMYPDTATGGVGCTPRPGRLSAYVFNPSGGQGAGAYHQPSYPTSDPTRWPGGWFRWKAEFQPAGASARVRLWVANTEVTWSSGALYSTYSVVPVAGNAPVRIGAGFLESTTCQQFWGALADIEFREGLDS